MRLAGGRVVRLPSFHAGIHGYIAGLASPTQRSHLQLDNRRAARPRCVAILLPLGCRTSSPTSPRRQGAPVHSSTVHHPGYNRHRCTTYVAAHPLRRDTPDQKGCNAYGSGALPHRQQACTWFFSLAPPTPAPNRPRPRSTALDTTAMH